jgi:hypothetical protein
LELQLCVPLEEKDDVGDLDATVLALEKSVGVKNEVGEEDVERDSVEDTVREPEVKDVGVFE